MRQERETLLTLLEAFVYDPLVDWTPGLAGINALSFVARFIVTVFSNRAPNLSLGTVPHFA
jgi:hypothetical protein